MSRANPDVVVLNGGSSSGKSTIARALQERLPGLWLTVGVDTFVEALPGRGESPRADITFHADGRVEPGMLFRSAEQAWYRGLAATARAGSPLILDEVFLSGGAAQEALRVVLADLHVLWVGVRCDADVAEAREARRPDRVAGMARDQADRVHIGMSYDLKVDTADTAADTAADVIVEHLRTG